MNIVTQTTTKLQKVPQAVRDEINAGPSDADTHRHYMQLACMNSIEQGGEGSSSHLPREFRVAAWNLERCLNVKASAKLLARPDPDIILLSEMDSGMSRTAQKHTVKRLASRLNMYYLYGVEFLELDLGSDMDKQYAEDDFNKRGFHGNAILSKMPIEDVAMLRFDDHGHWFAGQQVGDCFGQRRVGGRMALMAIVKTENNQRLCVVSTHFESNAGIAGRDRQMFDLVTAAEAFADSDTPIIIGGDLNAGNNLAHGLTHHAESFFETAEEHGFHWRGNKTGTTTRPSLLTQRPERDMKLDWFCARDIESHFQKIIPALDKTGMPLSDHDVIVSDWSLA
ncbi:MAG: endonuclease [Gammaproteobacteria bacterium]|nr:MAG: endonuclease [Gammaproteobacteria bacterium]